MLRVIILHFTYLLLLIILSVSAELEESGDFRRRSPGFFFTIPKTLLSGKNETVCLSLHAASLPTKVMVDLKIKEKHHITMRSLDSEHTCFEITIPHHSSSEPQFAHILIQLQLNNTIQSAHNQDPILIYPNKRMTFIETDRTIYKPGDSVKIRILTLTQDLLAMKKFKIPKVKLKNSLDITVSVWENITTELGLTHLEFQLTEDTAEGKWTVSANDAIHSFDVKKHILPRFKVILHHPKIIYTGGASVVFTVCAKYSFGYDVKGTALIKISSKDKHMKPLSRVKEMKNGCVQFEFSNEDLYLHELKENAHEDDSTNFQNSYKPVAEQSKQLHITATVVENGTSRIEIATGKSIFTFNLYSMKFNEEDKYFQPGLPYQGKLLIFNNQTAIKREVIEICYNVAVKRSWNIQNVNQCTNYTLKGDHIKFSIPPVKNNVIHLRLKARSLNRTNVGIKSSTFGGTFLVYRLYSPSGSYISINRNGNGNAECKSSQQFTVYYTTDKLKENETITFYYMIKSRDKIFKLRKLTQTPEKHTNVSSELEHVVGSKHKYTKFGINTDKFIIRFKLDEKIITKYQLLVYYVTRYGETVAATKEVTLEPCLVNKVEANWKKPQYYPGEAASLIIKTNPNSLCSISVVDKSTKFISGSTTLTINSLIEFFVQEREAKESTRMTCIPHTRKNAIVSLAGSLLEDDHTTQRPYDDLRKRRKRFVHGFSEDFDAYDTFNNFGVAVITNVRLITKPCYNGPIIEESASTSDKTAQFLRNSYDVLPREDKTVPVRTFFPETWIWELIPVNANGAAKIDKQLPHTITNWISSIVCVSPNEGLGLAKTVEVTAFQPFFVEVLTPYSIKRNEILNLHVKVFNYLNYSLPIRLTLRDFPGLDLVDERDEFSVIKCLFANDTFDRVFRVKSSILGKLNITVLTELENSYPEQCGPEVFINKRDVIHKIIIVEPEGYQSGITKSALLCVTEASRKNNVSWTLDVPDDIVANTAKAKLLFNSDLLGPTIENLEHFITIPIGCGEQIMATLAPNLYVLRYLNATNSLTTSLRQRAIRNIKIGYQKILKYVHKDGSFSAFGYHDPFGSMFLTTFVVRTLVQAKPHIYIDETVISKAVAWIFDHQLENGCFATMLHVFQDMGGTSTENSTAGLTSYIVISLIESGIELPEDILTNAKYCIRGHHIPDKYTLAISTYALFLANMHEEARRSLLRLLRSASKADNMLWWSNQGAGSSSSTDIEITSYALLSLLHQNSSDNLSQAHSVVRWLSTKRSPTGSFRTTQDTVVALDALTKYALMVNNNLVELKIQISANNHKQNVTINNNDRLSTKHVNLKNPNNVVTVSVEGNGCVLAQAVLSYNLRHLSVNKAFNLAVDVIPVSNIDQCSITTLFPCLAYTGPDNITNMAVLEIAIPSGYEADRASLHKLVTNNKVKKFEEINDRVVLYFTELSNENICTPFTINENSKIEGRSESLAKIYDYYKPEFEESKFYQLAKCYSNDIGPIPQLSNREEEIFDEGAGNLTKRDLDHLNPDFVHVDIDMEMPQGLEGNMPTYIQAPNNTTNNDL